jgi:hypothetical protein
MNMKYVRRHARKTAWAGAHIDEADLLNPFKNERKNVWNAENLASLWNEAFLSECHEIMIEDAENAADEEYHS